MPSASPARLPSQHPSPESPPSTGESLHLRLCSQGARLGAHLLWRPPLHASSSRQPRLGTVGPRRSLPGMRKNQSQQLPKSALCGQWAQATPLCSRPAMCNWYAAESFKHLLRAYLVRGTDLLSLRLSNTEMTAADTTIAQCECPVLNHESTGHIAELHLIGHVASQGCI